MNLNSINRRNNSSALPAEDCISEFDFERLARLIYQKWGINIPSTKKVVLEGRIRKRIQSLGMTSFRQYCKYLFSPEGQQLESPEMINVVTTNKTDFFREPDHFQLLENKLIAELSRCQRFNVQRPLRVWSAGCSSGEEPYTIAMVLAEFALMNSGFDYQIFASDISSRVLESARLGVYSQERIEPVPLNLRKKYLLKHRDSTKKIVRITPELRNKIIFDRINLMDIPALIPGPFQVIFCRNVLIYFDRETQTKIIKSLLSYLVPEGYLILGHSEHLLRSGLPLVPAGTTTYCYRNNPQSEMFDSSTCPA